MTTTLPEQLDAAKEAATAREEHAAALVAWQSLQQRERRLQRERVYVNGEGVEKDLSGRRTDGTVGSPDAAGLAIAEDEIAAERGEAARRLKAAELRLRKALAAETNEKLAPLGADHARVTEAVSDQLATLDDVAAALVVNLWHLDDLLAAERAIGRKMRKAARDGAFSDLERGQIDQLEAKDGLPLRIDENGDVANTATPDVELRGGYEANVAGAWLRIAEAGIAGRERGLGGLVDGMAEHIRQADTRGTR
jgi:hypothetical protein